MDWRRWIRAGMAGQVPATCASFCKPAANALPAAAGVYSAAEERDGGWGG
eukprot:CAMPEP_0174364126 /NCGR_PEP_ID=MMETSP0811_2-20130205/71625_1 /TAXON_ID=73025 ORGANISM="Eutreptiella gymnastica-like, Strain CCMP1594" /NCGR_SAMPLE_ID=MMETSP0811_2 /ASSEMBLY_ACC=CAM_ASM_000667 /LENGTH=49 /DNA_ID= /DNA_START= /DNA_END= /DNA_ORIENTATION=